ncbi:energy transducer TonB, partial [Hymenobacter agri]
MILPRILLALSLLGAPALRAQTTTVSSLADYAGPRYPGGPDSLRALVGRSIRQAVPAPGGRMLVQFELMPDGHPTRYTMLRPPVPLDKPLGEATAKALDYLEAHMLAWQPAPPDPEVTTKEAPKINLVIDFSTSPEAQPYPYADQNPVFGTLVQQLPERQQRYLGTRLTDPIKRGRFQSSIAGLVFFSQMQVRYPVEALRSRQQGTVYAAFEISETGAILQPEILGSAGRALDAEVMRALAALPAATEPAQLRG